ncbi:hypothetical protein [Rugamonas sp.]|uniref:hypothetical protein n=1 Tax=Rugamonas sp. TaxID=1926287 RepID=UPI0025E99F21|nr:hypothetical protein [Rugamonas sp.]
MKTLMLIPLLGALSLSAVAQTAQDQSDQQQQYVPVNARESRIELPADYHKMWPSDYSNYIKLYSLSNGMTLSIFSRGDTMYASTDHTWHKIVAVSPNTFVALDKQLKMHINLLDNDGASGDLLMVVPAQTLADHTILGEKVLYVAMH